MAYKTLLENTHKLNDTYAKGVLEQACGILDDKQLRFNWEAKLKAVSDLYSDLQAHTTSNSVSKEDSEIITSTLSSLKDKITHDSTIFKHFEVRSEQPDSEYVRKGKASEAVRQEYKTFDYKSNSLEASVKTASQQASLPVAYEQNSFASEVQSEVSVLRLDSNADNTPYLQMSERNGVFARASSVSPLRKYAAAASIAISFGIAGIVAAVVGCKDPSANSKVADYTASPAPIVQTVAPVQEAVSTPLQSVVQASQTNVSSAAKVAIVEPVIPEPIVAKPASNNVQTAVASAAKTNASSNVEYAAVPNDSEAKGLAVPVATVPMPEETKEEKVAATSVSTNLEQMVAQRNTQRKVPVITYHMESTELPTFEPYGSTPVEDPTPEENMQIARVIAGSDEVQIRFEKPDVFRAEEIGIKDIKDARWYAKPVVSIGWGLGKLKMGLYYALIKPIQIPAQFIADCVDPETPEPKAAENENHALSQTNAVAPYELRAFAHPANGQPYVQSSPNGPWVSDDPDYSTLNVDDDYITAELGARIFSQEELHLPEYDPATGIASNGGEFKQGPEGHSRQWRKSWGPSKIFRGAVGASMNPRQPADAEKLCAIAIAKQLSTSVNL